MSRNEYGKLMNKRTVKCAQNINPETGKRIYNRKTTSGYLANKRVSVTLYVTQELLNRIQVECDKQRAYTNRNHMMVNILEDFIAA